MGVDVERAAAGIVAIVNENMLGALRVVTVQKGLDPKDFALVAFGGAGGAARQRAGRGDRLLPGDRPARARRALRARLHRRRRPQRVRHRPSSAPPSARPSRR